MVNDSDSNTNYFYFEKCDQTGCNGSPTNTYIIDTNDPTISLVDDGVSKQMTLVYGCGVEHSHANTIKLSFVGAASIMQLLMYFVVMFL